MKKCPRCKGELRPDDIREEVDLQCDRCGRGWKKQPDGTWHSRWTATLEIVNAQGEYIDRIIPEVEDRVGKSTEEGST